MSLSSGSRDQNDFNQAYNMLGKRYDKFLLYKLFVLCLIGRHQLFPPRILIFGFPKYRFHQIE